MSEEKPASYTFEDFRGDLKEDIKRTERLMELRDELDYLEKFKET